MSGEPMSPSLRANPNTRNRPRTIQRQVRPTEIPASKTVVQREKLHNPQQPNTHNRPRTIQTQVRPTEIPASKTVVQREKLHNPQRSLNTGCKKMHPACCKCRQDIDPKKIFVNKCCDIQYMICPECYKTTHEPQTAYTCDKCQTNLLKEQFRLMDTSREKKHPKCDTCNKITMSPYKLPCNHQICQKCFIEKEQFVMIVKDGETVKYQYFVCCAKHGNEKHLFPVQRVHKISYGPLGATFDALACVKCERRLEGKAYELNCGHLICEFCYQYCDICRGRQTHRSRKIYMSDIKIAEVMNKKPTSDGENIHITQMKCLLSCVHYWDMAYVEPNYGEKLCVTCTEHLVETTLISFKTSESPVLQEYCICFCSTGTRKHLLPLWVLQKAASDLSYITDICYSRCKCSNNKAVVKFRECGHEFCTNCIKEMLSKEKKTKNEKLHGKREFCICNWCDVAVPSDQLEKYIQDHEDVVSHKGHVFVGAGTHDAPIHQTPKTLEDKESQRTKRIEDKKSIDLAAERDAEVAKPTKPYPGTDLHKQRTRTDNSSKGHCDNPGCNAYETMRTTISHIFPNCNHKLCVICRSLQQREHGDKLYCMAAKCRSSKRDYEQISGQSAYSRHQREIMGIPNIGLTCYASCILQILGQTPGFTEGLEKYSQQSKENHVEKILKNLLENVNVGTDWQFTIDWNLMERLMQKISQIDRSFRMYQENDCHSFIMTLLNALKKEDTEKEIKTGETMNSILDDESSNRESSKKGKPTVSKNTTCNTAKEQGQSPVVLFESRLVSKFTYGSCLHENVVDDQLFHSLLIPVLGNVKTLDSGLQKFFKGEEFEKGILQCSTCNVPNTRTVTTRILKISKAPEILMLQLARFEEVPQAGSCKVLRKTDHSVEFGKSLTLKKDYCEDRKELEYELYGVVIHSGSMHGGHYSSYVRKQHTNKWFYCSDSSVYEENESAIFEQLVFRHAYVLFYSKKGEQDSVC